MVYTDPIESDEKSLVLYGHSQSSDNSETQSPPEKKEKKKKKKKTIQKAHNIYNFGDGNTLHFYDHSGKKD